MAAIPLAIELVVMIVIGYCLEKGKLFSERFNADLATFVTNVALPCLIVKSMQMDFSFEELRNCGLLLLIGCLFFGLSFFVASVAYQLNPKDYRARIIRFGLIFSNFSFVGIPVTEALYGAQGVFYFVVFLVPMRIALYSLAKPLLTPPASELKKGAIPDQKKNRLGWLTPPLAAVPIGLILYVSGFQLPAIPQQILSWLATCCTPLALVLCGISLAKYPVKSLLKPQAIIISLLRCIAMPLITILVFSVLRIPANLAQPAIICSFLPVASTSVSYAIKYDSNPKAHFLCAGTILFSTLFCIATIPLWSYFMEVFY